MKKILILLIVSISLTIVIGSEVPDEEIKQTTQLSDDLTKSDSEEENQKPLVKRQAFFRPTGLFGLLSSFLRPFNYQQNYNRRPQINNYQQNYNRRPQINNYQQNQYYRPQQTFPPRIQIGFGYQPNYFNPYQNFDFIGHLNKLPRNSETFGYYLDPYHGRRLPENERHLWGPSEGYRESLRGRTAIFYYRGYRNFVSKIAFNPHRGVKMYVENVGNIPGI